MVLDSQGKIVRFNQACEQTTGYSFAEVKGNYFWDLFLIPEEVQPVKAIFENLQVSQFSNQYENYWVKRDGDRRLIAWSNTVICHVATTVEYIISTGIDITERQRAEEQVKLLQTLVLAIVDAQDFDKALEVVLRTVCETKGWNYGEAWIPCPDETVLICSSAWYSRADDRNGVTPAIIQKFRITSEKFTFPPGIGLPGRIWYSKQPEWRENILEEQETIFQRAEIARDYGLRAGLGIPLIVNEQVLAVLVFLKFESSKEDILLVESMTAVAAQLGSLIQHKQMEEVLRESEERFQVFMNNSPTVAFMKDEAGHFVYVNETFKHLFDVKLTELQGRTDFDFFPEAIAKEVRKNDVAVLSTGETTEFLETVPTPDGCPHYWLVFKFPVKYASGRQLLGGVALDVTERQQAEQALKNSQARLKLINSISTGITSGPGFLTSKKKSFT